MRGPPPPPTLVTGRPSWLCLFGCLEPLPECQECVGQLVRLDLGQAVPEVVRVDLRHPDDLREGHGVSPDLAAHPGRLEARRAPPPAGSGLSCLARAPATRSVSLTGCPAAAELRYCCANLLEAMVRSMTVERIRPLVRRGGFRLLRFGDRTTSAAPEAAKSATVGAISTPASNQPHPAAAPSGSLKCRLPSGRAAIGRAGSGALPRSAAGRFPARALWRCFQPLPSLLHSRSRSCRWRVREVHLTVLHHTGSTDQLIVRRRGSSMLTFRDHDQQNQVSQRASKRGHSLHH